MTDWGWFYFITKPMFVVIDWFYHLLGNFGLAILAVTVLVKIVFFPLANKSYASMAKMKAVQPQMMALRTQYAVGARRNNFPVSPRANVSRRLGGISSCELSLFQLAICKEGHQ